MIIVVLVVTVLADWLGVGRGDQHSIKHSSRGTALSETSRSFHTDTFFSFLSFSVSFLYIYLFILIVVAVAANGRVHAEATNQWRQGSPRKVETPG